MLPPGNGNCTGHGQCVYGTLCACDHPYAYYNWCQLAVVGNAYTAYSVLRWLALGLAVFSFVRLGFVLHSKLAQRPSGCSKFGVLADAQVQALFCNSCAALFGGLHELDNFGLDGILSTLQQFVFAAMSNFFGVMAIMRTFAFFINILAKFHVPSRRFSVAYRYVSAIFGVAFFIGLALLSSAHTFDTGYSLCLYSALTVSVFVVVSCVFVVTEVLKESDSEAVRAVRSQNEQETRQRLRLLVRVYFVFWAVYFATFLWVEADIMDITAAQLIAGDAIGQVAACGVILCLTMLMGRTNKTTNEGTTSNTTKMALISQSPPKAIIVKPQTVTNETSPSLKTRTAFAENEPIINPP